MVRLFYILQDHSFCVKRYLKLYVKYCSIEYFSQTGIIEFDALIRRIINAVGYYYGNSKLDA